MFQVFVRDRFEALHKDSDYNQCSGVQDLIVIKGGELLQLILLNATGFNFPVCGCML